MLHDVRRIGAGLTLVVLSAACGEGPVAVHEAAQGEQPAVLFDQGYPNETNQAPRKIAMLDDCFSGNTWPGGCTLAGGSVTLAQFQATLPRGHASWRNEPSYLKIPPGKHIKISNEGGRPHTFTHVATYGGGINPPANWPGTTPAPECVNAATRLASLLAPGESTRLENLEPGIHKYMCCFHPWMIAEIRVL